MKIKAWKLLVALLICNSIVAITVAIHYWRIGLSPLSGFIYAFILLLWYGIVLYALAFAMFYFLSRYLKSMNVYAYIAIGAGIGCLFPVCFGILLPIIGFADIQGFPVDIIGYTLAGAAYGWLHYYWIEKNNHKTAVK